MLDMICTVHTRTRIDVFVIDCFLIAQYVHRSVKYARTYTVVNEYLSKMCMCRPQQRRVCYYLWRDCCAEDVYQNRCQYVGDMSDWWRQSKIVSVRSSGVCLQARSKSCGWGDHPKGHQKIVFLLRHPGWGVTQKGKLKRTWFPRRQVLKRDHFCQHKRHYEFGP